MTSRGKISRRCYPGGICGLILLILLTLSIPACDQGGGMVNLRAEEVKKMAAERKNLLIIDTRTEEEYKDGHLPGAVLLPEQFSRIADRYLPPDKDRALIFYCRGSA